MATAKKRTTRKKTRMTFSDHLERIKSAKQECDNLTYCELLDARSASVALLWEIIFDTLCNSTELDISDFNTIAGIIQKLASAKVQTSHATEIVDANVSPESCGISAETLAKIEQQLKLL